jgi:acyl-CoA thioester hydrolase
VHTTTIHVRWGELDPYNHVNHAVYSSYLEHARVAALESADRGLDVLSGAGIQIVVVRSDVRFRAPATAGDELTITTRIADVRGASMVWEQHIHRGEEPIVSAEITAAVVAGGRPLRIPDDLKAVLSALR